MKKVFIYLFFTIAFIVAGLVTITEISNLALFDITPVSQVTGSRISGDYQVRPIHVGYKTKTIAAFKTEIGSEAVEI